MENNLKLNLFWEDKEKNTYNLGILYKENELYKFDIFEENLRKAIKNGCYGIGNFVFLNMHYESEELFDFFENRLPNEEDCKKLMQLYNIEKYDVLEILKMTQGRKFTDRYWIEEAK